MVAASDFAAVVAVLALADAAARSLHSRRCDKIGYDAERRVGSNSASNRIRDTGTARLKKRGRGREREGARSEKQKKNLLHLEGEDRG